MSLEDRAAAAAPLAASFPSTCEPQAAATACPSGDTAVRGDIDVVLPMRYAGARRLRLAWELSGPDGAPVVLVSGGISAGRHLAANASFPGRGWAEAVVGRGRALDPSQLRLLAFDHVGADGTLDALIDTADQADAVAVLLDALGIARLHAAVGYSYGAAVALQFAARHGARLERLVAISVAHRAHARFVARTPVLAWQRLSESLDLHRVDPARVRVPTTVVAVEGDPLVPLSEAVALVEGLGGRATLRVLRSPHGHDAFLKDDGRIDIILRAALAVEAAA